MFFKGAALILSYFASMFLAESLFLGFLSQEYFGWLPLFYGLLGNTVYSLIVVFRGLILLEADMTAKPFNKYSIILLFTRPFGAAMLNGIITPIIMILSKNLNTGLGEMIKGDGAQILIGLVVGMFFEYLIKKQLMDTLANKLTDKIKGDD